MKKNRKNEKENKQKKCIEQAIDYIYNHPMFAPFYRYTHIIWDNKYSWADDGWSYVTSKGIIGINEQQKGSVDEWIYVLAHCHLHLGFQHFDKQKNKEDRALWNIACDAYITDFLKEMKIGKLPRKMDEPAFSHITDEERLYEMLLLGQEDIRQYNTYGTAGRGISDMLKGNGEPYYYYGSQKITWQDLFAKGLADSVTMAVKVAAGHTNFLGDNGCTTKAEEAKKWFIDHYPLLGALAASFDIIEDPAICQRNNVAVGAVDEALKEIYINPAAGLNLEELRFVIAHELLHVGLRHSERCLGRDFYYWNVACDYVINQWLMEMEVGAFPQYGGLYDQELKGLSAESVYDIIVTDLRKYRKIMTLRGQGIGDIIRRELGSNPTCGTDLDEFYRQCLSQGLIYQQESGRGYLPSGLIEEIRALSQPPIPWDVELAKWFDQYFQPDEKVRTYARPSRRQASTPHIPRPRYVNGGSQDDGKTFAVVLDTSGSMDRRLLAMALGAIASYSIARDVYRVRVIFCDAVAYDQGYMAPDIIADRVKVKGRGGTVLQPAIRLLEQAEDFPKDGPILIITDGDCDQLVVKRSHAYLIPIGHHLPFIPKGKVFRMK